MDESEDRVLAKTLDDIIIHLGVLDQFVAAIPGAADVDTTFIRAVLDQQFGTGEDADHPAEQQARKDYALAVLEVLSKQAKLQRRRKEKR